MIAAAYCSHVPIECRAPVTLEAVMQRRERRQPALHQHQPLGADHSHASADTCRGRIVDRSRPTWRSGYSVDLGLMQVNSRNLAALGVQRSSRCWTPALT